jgi:hypothetical protein
MADFGESFLSAMQTGLSVARSYRDEARLNEQIKRQNRRDDLTEKLALSAEERAAGEYKTRQEAATYEMTLRPRREKALDLQLETGTLQNEGLKIDNEWKPQRYKADVEQSQAATASSRASAGYTGVLARNARIQGDIAQMTLNDLRDNQETHKALSVLLNGGDIRQYGTRLEAPLLQFTGLVAAAERTREVLGRTSRGDFSWTQDRGAVASVQNFLRPEAARSANARGLNAGTADVASFAPAKGGVAVKYSAFDRNGNIQVWQEVLPADKLFAKVDIAGGAAAAFRNNPKATQSALAFYQSVNPEGYKKLIGAAQESVDDKIESFRTAASKASNPSEKRAFEAKATELEQNRDSVVASQAMNYLGITGNKMGSYRSANVGLNTIKRYAPNISDEEAAQRSGVVIQQMRAWEQNGTLARLKNSGVLPGNKMPSTWTEYINAYYAVTTSPKGKNILSIR